MRRVQSTTLLRIVTALALLASAGMLVWAAQAYKHLIPPGSSELKLRPVTPFEAKFSYQLPRGETWTSVITRLKGEGWTIYDVGSRVLWPDATDEGRTSATFWRTGWFRLFQQWLTVRRVFEKPPVFVVEIIQCARFAPSRMCP